MAGSRSNLHRDPPGAFRAGIVVRALVTAVAVVWALAAASARPAAPQSAAHASGIVDRVRALERAAIHGDSWRGTRSRDLVGRARRALIAP